MYDFAILGGAFNPIHNGHIYIAKEIIRKRVAQKVIFMPNGNHPLKSTNLLLAFEQRYHLIELAISNNSQFEVSDLDSPQYGINYTYNLIQRVIEHYSEQEFTFIIGYDNALSFSKWYQWEWLLDNVNFTVVSRNSDSFAENKEIDKRFNIIEIEPYDISSTEIRAKLEKQEDLTALIPKETIENLIIYWKNLK